MVSKAQSQQEVATDAVLSRATAATDIIHEKSAAIQRLSLGGFAVLISTAVYILAAAVAKIFL